MGIISTHLGTELDKIEVIFVWAMVPLHQVIKCAVTGQTFPIVLVACLEI